jgi:N-acetylmuramoyl-L-alanine amidase
MVLIDAAHGGDDSGARINATTVEKNITLALSVRLRSLLGARGIEVTTTREADKTIDADQRAELANRASASACVILHATSSGTGVHLFISSLTPQKDAKLAAWRTAQSPYVQQSTALAASVNSTLTQAGVPVTLARINLPGLDSMTCPAIAIELANPAPEESKPATALTDAAYQAHIADLLATALIEWRAEAHRP